jgi:ATP-dependent RNA helicase DDX19/DBP5
VLSGILLQGVYALGFNAPSKIQETALPTLLADPPQVSPSFYFPEH